MKIHQLLIVFIFLLGGWDALTAALTNVALTGTASSSSQGYGTVAADGNDGNRDGIYANGSVFHANNESIQSFWQVQLAGVRYLDHVRIFNRTDAVQGSV